MPRAGLAAVVTAAALWALAGTLAGELFEHGADPLEVVAVRTWAAAAGLLALLLLLRRLSVIPSPAPTAAPWRSVVAFGLAVAVANGALFLTIERLPVAVALVLQNLAPAFVAVWMSARTRELPSPRVLVGLVAVLAGVALVVELPTAPLDGLDPVGVALGVVTAAALAAFSLLGGRVTRKCGALTANTWAFAVAGLAWLVAQCFSGIPELLRHPDLLARACLIGVAGTLAPFVLYAWGTVKVGAQAAAVNISLEPLFGAVLAWVWLGQTIGGVQAAGAVVMIAAVVAIQLPRRRARFGAVRQRDDFRSPASKPDRLERRTTGH